MKQEDRIYSLLGLASKAGLVASGEFSVEQSVKKYKARLVIVTDDASDNTKQLFTNKCKFYKIPIMIYGDKLGIAHAIGKELRTSIAVEDTGLAQKILGLARHTEVGD